MALEDIGDKSARIIGGQLWHASYKREHRRRLRHNGNAWVRRGADGTADGTGPPRDAGTCGSGGARGAWSV